MTGLSPPVGQGRHARALAERIAEAIWSGELLVGDRVPPERDLADRLGLSRPTVRTALRALCREGLLEVRRGRAGGSFVRTDLVPERLLPPLPGQPPDVLELLEARRAVEIQVALLAALHATEADVHALTRIVERQRSAPHDWEAGIQLDVKFHLQLARAARNEVILVLARTLQRQVWRSRLQDLRMPHDVGVVADIHERTVRAVASRDAGEVERVMDEHLGWLERAWEREHAAARREQGAAGAEGAASRRR
jgi:GntR family transcriptional repressor for pyruvate dehydrogenase complex